MGANNGSGNREHIYIRTDSLGRVAAPKDEPRVVLGVPFSRIDAVNAG